MNFGQSGFLLQPLHLLLLHANRQLFCNHKNKHLCKRNIFHFIEDIFDTNREEKLKIAFALFGISALD